MGRAGVFLFRCKFAAHVHVVVLQLAGPEEPAAESVAKQERLSGLGSSLPIEWRVTRRTTSIRQSLRMHRIVVTHSMQLLYALM
jgi:hypothetical protein